MDRHLSEERIKPFRLVKYFTFSGLVVIFLVTLILTILNTHWVKSMQRKKSEDYAHALIENLNHQVFLQFILPIGMKYGKVQLRNQEQFERMDNVVRSTLHSFKVEDLNIYSMNNTISYSFDEARIGVNAVGGTAFEQAKSGRSSSKLVQRGSFMEILLGFPKEVNLVNETYPDKESLLKGAETLALEIASCTPLAVQGAKEVLNYCRGKSIADGLEYVAARSAMILPSEDMAETMTAFMEKRAPVYKGK